jgi:hypothetical protein
VIGVENAGESSLILSENNDFSGDQQIVLFAPSIDTMSDTTYGLVPHAWEEGVLQNNGDFSDRNNDSYYAYSFYIKNIANIPVSYTAELTIDAVYRNLDAAIRANVIMSEFNQATGKWEAKTDVIYAKPESTESIAAGFPTKMVSHPENSSQMVPMLDYTVFKLLIDAQRKDPSKQFYNYYLPLTYDAVPFISESLVMQQTVLQMASEFVQKFTVIFWLEGNDFDTTSSLDESIIRMSMLFSQIS